MTVSAVQYKHINSKYFHRKKKYSRRKHVFRRNSLAEIHPKNGFPGPFSGRKNLGFPVIFMAESEIPMETLAVNAQEISLIQI